MFGVGAAVATTDLRSTLMGRVRNTEATVAALLVAARDEFAEKGFLEAKTESIVDAAGVTRGALYHHFRDKTALFDALVERMQEEIATDVARSAKRGRSPFDAFRRGCDAYLNCCVRPDVRQIVLLDGPAVLGWERWRELDERNAYRATLDAVRACVASGEFVKVEPEPMARVLLATITQVGLEIARTDDAKRHRRELGRSVDLLLDRLRAE